MSERQSDAELFKKVQNHFADCAEKPEFYDQLVERTKLKLNLGCGGQRPTDKTWLNIDTLHDQFPDVNCKERVMMDAEPNYLNHDVSRGLPMFEDNSILGIVASHFFEHLDCLTTVRVFKECHRVLKPGGVFRVGCPDPAIFHEKTITGDNDWGQPEFDLGGAGSFMEYALFFGLHKQLISLDALFCMFWVSGFRTYERKAYTHSGLEGLAILDNREKFSLFAEAVK